MFPAMGSGLRTFLFQRHKSAISSLCIFNTKRLLVSCLLTSATIIDPATTALLVNHQRYQRLPTLGHCITNMSPSTRRSVRGFQSMTNDDGDSEPSIKRKAPWTPSNPAATTRRRSTVNGDTPFGASIFEQASRRELQSEAKKHGIKANQKSSVLRSELQSVMMNSPEKKKVQTPVPITPDNTVTSSPAASISVGTPSSTKKKARPKRKSPAAKQVSKSPPKDWLATYTLVEELREDRSAPVDSDGGEALPEDDKGPETYRFQILVALMLSSQTKDAVVGDTMRKLQKHGLTVENIQKTSPEKLNELIRKVGFHNNKTKYLKQSVDILINEYGGDIPPTAQAMMELPGVGPKMAFIVENVAYGKQTGIGVDTHMHRIFNQLNWVKSKNPEQTRIQLEAWLPTDYWRSVNLLWVGFGQEVQQFKPKLLRKALECSRPKDALRLVNKLGLDYKKEGKKLGIEEEIATALKKE